MKIKKTLEPEQITCVIDTREQTPADVAPLKSVRGTLATGDYSLLGLEHYVAIERKSLSDLIGCVGRERERFDREIQRLLAYPVRAIVVESNWSNLDLKQYRGELHPNAVFGSIAGWCAQGVNIIMAGDHERAGRLISRMLYITAKRRWHETHGFITEIISDVGESLKNDEPIAEIIPASKQDFFSQ